MRNDLARFLTFLWRAAMVYFIYSIWSNLGYMTDLVHAYIQMVMEHTRR